MRYTVHVFPWWFPCVKHSNKQVPEKSALTWFSSQLFYYLLLPPFFSTLMPVSRLSDSTCTRCQHEKSPCCMPCQACWIHWVPRFARSYQNWLCMSSPQFKSRYCKQHVTRACCGESEPGTTLSDPEASVPVESAVVEMLLAKETRGQTYYQVYDTFNLLWP